MTVRQWSAAVAVTALCAPIIGRAQSSPPPSEECQRACLIEYEGRLARCEQAKDAKDAKDKDACYREAVLAQRTCLAICH